MIWLSASYPAELMYSFLCWSKNCCNLPIQVALEGKNKQKKEGEKKKKVEDPGINPSTTYMLSKRSTM